MLIMKMLERRGDAYTKRMNTKFWYKKKESTLKIGALI